MSGRDGRADGRLEALAVPLLVAALVLVWGAAVGFTKIRSLDYWWHLRTGALILETGAVPTADPYSYTAPGARWVDLHWLFQLGLHGLHALGGHEAVRLAKGVAVWAVLVAAALAGFRRERAAMTGLALVLLAMVGSTRFLERPDLPSFVLLAAVVGLLFRHEERGGRALFAIVPLQLLWANLHGLFAVGLAAIAMALAAEALRPLVRPGERLRPGHLARLAAVLALSLVASLVNPNGRLGLVFPLVQLGMIGSWQQRGLFGQVINELQPTLGLGPVELAPAAALATLVAAGLVANRRRVSLLDGLLAVAFGYLALSARRNLALFAVVAVPLVTRNLGAVWEGALAPRRRAAASVALLALLVGGGGAFAAHELAWAWKREGASSAALMPFQYPEAAVDWIARERPAPPLYHRMADGGYLIARLFPDYRVMVDGRLEVYGAERFARLDVLDAGAPVGFARLDAEHRFGTALLHHAFLPDHRLLAWLFRHPDWRLVQIDEVAAVFVRAPGAGGGLPWPAVDPGAPDLFPPLDPDARPAIDLWRRRARIRILAALGRPGPALALADETLALHRSADVLALRDWLREQAPLGQLPHAEGKPVPSVR